MNQLANNNLTMSSREIAADKHSQLNCEKVTAEEIIEIMEFCKSQFYKDNADRLPSRLMDCAILGVAATQLGEACVIHDKALKEHSKDSSLSAWKATAQARDLADSSLAGSMGSEQLSSLKFMVNIGMISMLSRGAKQKTVVNEKAYQQEIVKNFSKYFPDYEMVGSEVKVSDCDGDRIDILASCVKTQRTVIIELKLGKKSAHKQLRSYAYEYKNPILINITELEVKNKREGINYYTYDDIGLNKDCL